MDDEKIRGYKDQELLFRALVTYSSKAINRSEQLTTGIMRLCITEWVTKKNMSLKEVKHLVEEERFRIVSEIIDIFLDKIKHQVESKLQRDNLKKNILQIYNQWKKTKRDPLSEEVIPDMEQLD